MAKELLLEIGTEEIPSGFVPNALKDMKELIEKELKNLRIGFGQIKTLGTPRRLVLYIDHMSDKQEDTYIEIIGPSKKVALDQNGNPTKAAIGFARAQGINPSDLQQVSTLKGEYLAVRKKETGNDTKRVLSSILPRFIASIPFPKSMRWGDSSIRFARPIHWILCIFNGEIVPFKMYNIESGDHSFGHRFMSPDQFKVQDFNHYIKHLRDAYVIIDPIERKDKIKEIISQAAKAVSGKVLEDDELLDDVTYLLEYPTATLGRFEERFLNLPREVMISSMREHQKYFSVVDDADRLLPYFIAVNNTLAKDHGIVVSGNERVLKARLSDARFFFKEDQKIPFPERVYHLKEVVFQSELGTFYEKVMRFQKMAECLALEIKPELKEISKKAAILCKADLTSGMVGEFPKLQGIMGREYALLSGEDVEVATAIYEHYLPRFSGDILPSTHAGAFVSIADKLDTVVGCFGVGLIPTGTSDPYALRRQALGIVNIILDKRYPISLKKLIEINIEYLNGKISRDPVMVKEGVLEFFRLRLQYQLTSQGYSYDIIDAVLSLYFDDLADSFERIKALQELKNQPDFKPLAIAFKRASNILSQSSPGGDVFPSLFQDSMEDTLFEAYKEIEEYVVELISKKRYLEALIKMVQLRKPVDDFFDNVMVMVEDEKTRKNRLAILAEISGLFLNIADFSKIITE
ncbi:MAG: glycine--tRNA ligase subunit beta [Thermodesulfobacteriota bacterium]